MENTTSIQQLTSDGKIHKRLIFQLRLLTIISFILLGIVVYQIIAKDLSPLISGSIAIVSFVLGVLVFSRMNKLVWSEEEEVIKTGRMEIVGVFVILLYIGFEITLRTILKAEFPGTFAATAYLFAGIGGSLLGRSVGTLFTIREIADDKSNPL